MTKTNKSYTKRLKATRTGKLVAQTPGLNHFNAKASGEKHLHKKRTRPFIMSSKARGRFFGRKRP